MTLDYKHFVDQLGQLIATPSVSCTQPTLDMGNRPVIDLLANWLEPMGFAIEIQPLPNQPNKANLIATLGEGNSGLVFAGHTDTVPYDAEHWQQDPFTLTIDDGRAFGLGATDMKGFFPTVLAAIQPFINRPLSQPIIIVATADEETSMAGARALVHDRQPKARYAIIGEPTGMSPIRLHKGITMEAIHIQGQSGHSSNPQLGKNALDAMHDVMTELKQFRHELQKKYHHADFDIQVPTLNFGCIHGGDNPNRICDSCELEFDLRPLPGMSLDDLREAIDRRLSHTAKEHQLSITRTALFDGINAFEQEKSSPLIQTIEALTQQQASSVAFGTEAPFFKELGMDVVVMGPGSINQAHQPNEYIDLAEVNTAVPLLQNLIRHFCC